MFCHGQRMLFDQHTPTRAVFCVMCGYKNIHQFNKNYLIYSFRQNHKGKIP